MPAVALSAWVRAWSSPVLTGRIWLPVRGSGWRRCPTALAARADLSLACLVAVAVCAFTAAGNDRFTAVGQWIRRASQAELARLGLRGSVGWPVRVPDEKTIRVVLDRLDARALTRALLGPSRAGAGARHAPPASVRGYRARRAAQQAKALARDGYGQWRWMARPPAEPAAPTAPGHLLGAAEHGGHLLDHLEVDIKHNETSHSCTPGAPGPGRRRGDLRRPAYGAGEPELAASKKQAQYIAVVKKNQPLLHARIRACLAAGTAGSITRDTGHGRIETRT